MGTDARYYRFAMKLFADFSGTIAIPAVLAALAGQWLDEKYQTQPRYIIILLFLAFAFTGIILVRKANQYKKEYEQLMK